MSNWDAYYLAVARAVAQNSKCLSRQIGAILVRDKSIISTGYNGPPRGVPHCSERYRLDPALSKFAEYPGQYAGICPRSSFGYRSGEGLHLCIASHAEVNCINNAARNGTSTLGASLYLSCELMPCKNCLCEIINAGIQEVVAVELKPYDQTSLFILEHSGIKIRAYRQG